MRVEPDAGSFTRFAAAAHAVRDSRGTRAKTRVVARYLASLPERALPLAAVYFTGRPFPRVDERALQVGGAILSRAAKSLLPWDDVVLAACYRAVGDAGETFGKLFALDPPQEAQGARQATLAAFAPSTAAAPFSLEDAAASFDALAAARQASQKGAILERAWRRLDPLGVQYFTKIITGGMRIGLAESLVEDAVAQAFDRKVGRVRHANMVTGDIGHAAVLAKRDALHEARFRLFHPLHFMLATPLDPDDVAKGVAEPDAFLVEDKFDGIRAQLHKSSGRAVLYSRTLDEAPEFPEVLVAARRVPGAFVLDGEVVAWKGGRALPFGQLQRRLGRKRVDAALAAEVPVRFIAYDVLYANGEETYRLPFTERRRVLDALALAEPISRSPVHKVASVDDVEALFETARERGNEGVMLKRKDSDYRFGKRGKQWLKLKRAFATLDVVVTAAEGGHGKRAGLLSDVTFAVRDDATGELVNVGKAYTGLTDQEIKRLTTRFRRITRERYGSVHVVEPEVVLEVAFDSVQRSTRHKSGFALRFPRIVRERPDLRVDDVDTVSRVEELALRSLGMPR